MKNQIFSLLVGLGLLGCGPQVDEASASANGAGEGGEVSDDDGELPEAERASWALGFFYDADSELPFRDSYLRMYELREDGTGVFFEEGCLEGVVGPHPEFAWRLVDDNTVELFDPGGGNVEWIRSRQDEVVTLAKVEDGRVRYQVTSDATQDYVRGKLCVVEDVEVKDFESCFDHGGFMLDVCE